MNTKYISLFFLLLLGPQRAWCESVADPETVHLYQVGKAGDYCLSISPDASGCVSGTDGSGNNINVLDFIRGRKVVFENLSDAPHDMKISGANGENLPAQDPNASAVQKQMAVIDLSKQKITCSFHGDQLALGYRVKDQTAATDTPAGHQSKESEAAAVQSALANSGETNPMKLRRTGLANVGKEVVAKASPEEVANLVAARPEMMDELKKVRPLLAQEIASSGTLANRIKANEAQRAGVGANGQNGGVPLEITTTNAVTKIMAGIPLSGGKNLGADGVKGLKGTSELSGRVIGSNTNGGLPSLLDAEGNPLMGLGATDSDGHEANLNGGETAQGRAINKALAVGSSSLALPMPNGTKSGRSASNGRMLASSERQGSSKTSWLWLLPLIAAGAYWATRNQKKTTVQKARSRYK